MTTSRRGFLSFAALLGGAMLLLRRFRKEDAGKPVKFLTQDGRLVELDSNKIPAKRIKASNTDVKTWIWKKMDNHG